LNQHIYDWDSFIELGKTSFGRERLPLFLAPISFMLVHIYIFSWGWGTY